MILLHVCGEELFVNPYHVSAIIAESDGSEHAHVMLLSGRDDFYVDESPKEVAQLVNRAIVLWRKG